MSSKKPSSKTDKDGTFKPDHSIRNSQPPDMRQPHRRMHPNKVIRIHSKRNK